MDAETRLVLPLDEYDQPPADRSDVLRAENILIEACAAQHRIAIRSVDLLPPPTSESASSLLGLVTAKQASTAGYWVPPEQEASGRAGDAHIRRILASCVTSARARLGDEGRPQLLVDRAVGGALARMDADSRVRRAERAWSRCMRLRGFFESEPQEPVRDSVTPFPTPQDTRTASADVACERATDLPGVRAAVLAADERRIIAAPPAGLLAARADLDAETRLAAQVLHPGSPRTPPATDG